MVEFLEIQLYCLACAGGLEKAIDTILLPWRPHHRKVARYVNIFLRVAIFCALNVATVAIICALNVATVATFN